jgi:Domain of unknown function (DUF4178)
MSRKSALCPNCGAPIEFLWSSVVQTTCPFCRSVLVRRDVNLELVGKVADLPKDSSAIQIGVEGVYQGKPFVVVGRIIYEYEQGGWNEWHIVFNDQASGWLSDAQAQYDVSFLVPGAKLPAQVERGQRYTLNGSSYEVTAVTHARYRTVEGEMPFENWDKKESVFADLRTPDARFGTIDYSEPTPLLFLGEAVEFDDLRLKNLRQFEGWP